jgi:hypothetical protein
MPCNKILCLKKYHQGKNFQQTACLHEEPKRGIRRGHLCGLVARVPGYRSKGPGSIPGASGSGTGSTQPREYNWGRKSSGSGLENREYNRGDPLRWPRDTLYPQKLALTSPTSVGRSVGIFRLRTQATELVCLLYILYWLFKDVILKPAFSVHPQPRIVGLVTPCRINVFQRRTSSWNIRIL